MTSLWEILVPTMKDGKPVRTRYHRVWDSKVREISGGLTILKPVKGQWIDKDNALFDERMIPVRIKCTDAEIEKIADMTAKYYNQKAIMFYAVSERIYIKHYGEVLPPSEK